MSKMEILNYSYWEHIKAEKELSRILPPEHPRRIELNKTANIILEKIKKLNEHT